MEELEELERRFLLERHLISMELVREPMGRALLVSADESCGLMINEEDHLRIQTFGSGLDPLRILDHALALAGELQERLAFAHSDRLGNLTACPTNVGTGLRASILVHLPGLVLTRDLEKVLNSLRILNYTVRGFYGEGSGVMGALFQVSNTATLGLSEAQIVDDLLHHVRKVISVERDARAVLLERERARLEDRVWRAWGILLHARLLGTREAFDLLGDVRLGTSIHLLPRLDESILEALLVTIQAAHLQIAEGRSMEAEERDAARALTIRRGLMEAQKEPESGTRKDEE
jgi:protein arginine kinase